MSTEKLIHDIPFVIEAERRRAQSEPVPTITTAIVQDELHALMAGVEVKVETAMAMPRVRFLSLKNV